MALRRNSRYLLTDVVEVRDPISGKLTRPPFVDLRQRVLDYSPTDFILRPDDTLSWPHLGDSKLLDARHWWVIADLSLIVDPFSELGPEAVLRCPTIGRTEFSILPGDQGVERNIVQEQ